MALGFCPLLYGLAISLGCNGAGSPPPAASPGRVPAAKAAIAGLTIATKENEVRKILGTPLRVSVEKGEITGELETRFFYRGVEVLTVSGEVYNVVCKTPDYATPDGARVGQPLAKIIETYGTGETILGDEETRVRYNIPGTDRYLVFHVRDGVVVTIELWFDYT